MDASDFCLSLSCDVRREYQKTGLFCLLLPIEYPDYSPAIVCRPTSSFPTHRKENISYKGPTVDVSTSKGLRRSLRETGVVIGKRDDESEFQRRGEGAER